MAEVLVALIVGIVAPIVFSVFQEWRRERKWAAPRKRRLAKMLKDASVSKDGWRSLRRLCLETGMTPEDCRTLLIEINARGGEISDPDNTGQKIEAWRLDKLDD